jgi:hypothetical protein
MVSSITRIDTTRLSTLDRLRRDAPGATIATLGELPRRSAPGRPPLSDTLASEEADLLTNEPLQVHRIPLQPLMATSVAMPIAEAPAPFEWQGVVAPGFAARIPVFTMAQAGTETVEPLSNFLIPLINNSYRGSRNDFIGIQMTSILVKEITRLVSEHKEANASVGLLAEQSDSGDYYLRIFPQNAPLASAALPR